MITPGLTLANSEDTDEMPNDVAFHQSLYYLLWQKQYSQKEIQFYLRITICDALICTMDYPTFIVSNQNVEAISA